MKQENTQGPENIKTGSPVIKTTPYGNAFISSPLDFCNAPVSGLPKKNVCNLHLLPNSAIWVLMKPRMQVHITPVL